MQAELLTTLEQRAHPQHAAILVIDMQNDFVSDEGWAASVGWNPRHNQTAARRTAWLLERAREAKVAIVFVQAIYDEMYLSAPMLERNRRRGIEGPRCISGTWGAEFYLLEPRPGEPIVRKHRYSAFAETELSMVLRQSQIKSLLFAGVYTEGCVESTARDAYFLDYYVTLIDDCCATTTPEIHRGVLERCERDWGMVTTSTDLVAAWQAVGALSASTTSVLAP
jgi:ureidoacrylate peracid hydrolase